jgi:glycosyltransferase involved in cell wall biosynthesis
MSTRLRIRPSRIDVIPRGRDPELLGSRTEVRRQRVRRELNVDPKSKLLIAAARQEHQKGLDVLLDAMPAVVGAVPEARLLIAGREGNQTPVLQRRMGTLGLGDAVEFLGARSDVADLLSAADAFVFPSRFEGLGSVLIEAMALEAPIVASALPPVAEILHSGEHALLVPTERPDVLAKAIVDVLIRSDMAAARARAAHTRFLENYTIGAVADGMVRFYEQALAGPRRHIARAAPRGREAPLG